MEKININGINLAYTRRGRGTPLVLIHGYPLDHTIWDEAAQFLEATFDLIMPDVRGFGESTTAEAQYGMEDLASDVACLLDHLGLDRAAVAGHSMGGYIALAFARMYPQRVLGLGLISSQAAADTPERKEGRYKTAAQVAERGAGVVAESMTAKLSADPRVQGFVRALIERQSRAALIGALKSMAERSDSTSVLSSIDLPIVLIHSDGDELIPIERAREMKMLRPKARLIELAGKGHMPMMEAPRETADGLLSLSAV